MKDDSINYTQSPAGSVVIATANEREAAAVHDLLVESSNKLSLTVQVNTDPILPHIRGMLEGKERSWTTYLVQADETGGAEAVDLLRRALTQFNPNYIFFVGCAALLNERHSPYPNQVFVARSAYDADKYEASSKASIYDMGQHRADLGLIRNIEALKTAGRFKNIRVETRRHFISGSVFMKDKRSRLRRDIISRFPPDAVVWEMEAFDVFKALYNLRMEGHDVGLAVIKGISDFGDEDAQSEKDEKQRTATKNAMIVVATLLRNLAPL